MRKKGLTTCRPFGKTGNNRGNKKKKRAVRHSQSVVLAAVHSYHDLPLSHTSQVLGACTPVGTGRTQIVVNDCVRGTILQVQAHPCDLSTPSLCMVELIAPTRPIPDCPYGTHPYGDACRNCHRQRQASWAVDWTAGVGGTPSG